MTKPRLTLEEHKYLGNYLFLKNHEFQTILVELAKKYPQNNKCIKLVRLTLSSISKLRSCLDDNVGKEFPELSSSELNKIYYPGYYTLDSTKSKFFKD
jgi:hypothetical protein